MLNEEEEAPFFRSRTWTPDLSGHYLSHYTMSTMGSSILRLIVSRLRGFATAPIFLYSCHLSMIVALRQLGGSLGIPWCCVVERQLLHVSRFSRANTHVPRDFPKCHPECFCPAITACDQPDWSPPFCPAVLPAFQAPPSSTSGFASSFDSYHPTATAGAPSAPAGGGFSGSAWGSEGFGSSSFPPSDSFQASSFRATGSAFDPETPSARSGAHHHAGPTSAGFDALYDGAADTPRASDTHSEADTPQHRGQGFGGSGFDSYYDQHYQGGGHASAFDQHADAGGFSVSASTFDMHYGDVKTGLHFDDYDGASVAETPGTTKSNAQGSGTTGGFSSDKWEHF